MSIASSLQVVETASGLLYDTYELTVYASADLDRVSIVFRDVLSFKIDPLIGEKTLPIYVFLFGLRWGRLMLDNLVARFSLDS